MFKPVYEGAFWEFLTEKAIAFGQGQPDKLAAVTLAKWLSENGIEFHWHPDTLRFDIGESWKDVEAKGDTTGDTRTVKVTPEASYTFAVTLSGTLEPIACIWGLTYRSRWDELIEQHPNGVPVGQLLTAADWLRSFPHHWTPCAEVAQAETQAAIAAG